MASTNSDIRQCSKTGGKALHASAAIKADQVLSHFGAKEVFEQPNYLTVQIGDRQHIMLDPEYLQYINHHCNPNVFFDTQKMQVLALRDIEIGEELTFFYPSTEWSMEQSFECLCGSDTCIEKIRGAAHIPVDKLVNYRLSEYIKSKVSEAQ